MLSVGAGWEVNSWLLNYHTWLTWHRIFINSKWKKYNLIQINTVIKCGTLFERIFFPLFHTRYHEKIVLEMYSNILLNFLCAQSNTVTKFRTLNWTKKSNNMLSSAWNKSLVMPLNLKLKDLEAPMFQYQNLKNTQWPPYFWLVPIGMMREGCLRRQQHAQSDNLHWLDHLLLLSQNIRGVCMPITEQQQSDLKIERWVNPITAPDYVKLLSMSSMP